MKYPLLLLTLLALATIPAPAGAVPAASISWDGCTGPSDKAMLPGQTVSIYASVLGHSEPHRGYYVPLMLYTGYGPLPDAWRFDVAGCQGSPRLAIDHLAPAEVAAVCPSFQGTLPSFQLKECEYDFLRGFASTYLAVAYPNGGLGNTTQVNPAQRYFLGRWKFDHSISVAGAGTPGQSCGSFEGQLCIASISLNNNAASWVTPDNVEHAWAFQSEFVTTNGHVGCPGTDRTWPIPAQSATWGAIKNQYR